MARPFLCPMQEAFQGAVQGRDRIGFAPIKFDCVLLNAPILPAYPQIAHAWFQPALRFRATD